MVSAAVLAEAQRQLEASYNAIRAALITTDTVLRLLAEAQGSCDHRDAENATASGGEPRRYCPACRKFIYNDGRTEDPA